MAPRALYGPVNTLLCVMATVKQGVPIGLAIVCLLCGAQNTLDFLRGCCDEVSLGVMEVLWALFFSYRRRKKANSSEE